jgi:hypothetical protein
MPTPTPTPPPGPTPTPPTSGEEIQPAPIHDVRIDFLQTEPVQVSVYIKMGLRDTCTKFHDLTSERSGNTITIQVTTGRTKDAVCGQIYTFFENNVNLGSNFILGQTYAVRVNDQTTTFVMPYKDRTYQESGDSQFDSSKSA